MSGPKSYAAEVVDKHLKLLFLVRSEIILQWKKLDRFSFDDDKRNISISADDFKKEHQPTYDKIVNAIPEISGGELNQQQFDHLYNNIHNVIEKADRFKKMLDSRMEQMQSHLDAYHLYLELEELVVEYKSKYDLVIRQLTEYLERKSGGDPEFEKKKINLEQTPLKYSLPPFDEEFSTKFDDEKQKLITAFEEARKKLTAISGMSQPQSSPQERKTKVVLAGGETEAKPVPEKDYAEISNKISIALQKVDGLETRSVFQNRLDKLLKKTTASTSYFLAELHEDILRYTNQQQLRQQMKILAGKIEDIEFDPELTTEAKKLKERLYHEMQREMIKTDDLTRVSDKLDELVRKNSQLIRDRIIARQEQVYIKSRLVSALEDLNYEVVEDAEVINFEEANTFLMKIPEQPNFLNVRFDPSGRMLYNFLIPEDREDLSYDDKAVKLSEMEETCNSFKLMLDDLRKQGLKIGLQHELEISEKALVRLPEKFRKKVEHSLKTGKKATKHQGSLKKRKK